MRFTTLDEFWFEIRDVAYIVDDIFYKASFLFRLIKPTNLFN